MAFAEDLAVLEILKTELAYWSSNPVTYDPVTKYLISRGTSIVPCNNPERAASTVAAMNTFAESQAVAIKAEIAAVLAGMTAPV